MHYLLIYNTLTIISIDFNIEIFFHLSICLLHQLLINVFELCNIFIHKMKQVHQIVHPFRRVINK
jgi:hypothetical protein